MDGEWEPAMINNPEYKVQIMLWSILASFESHKMCCDDDKAPYFVECIIIILKQVPEVSCWVKNEQKGFLHYLCTFTDNDMCHWLCVVVVVQDLKEFWRESSFKVLWIWISNWWTTWFELTPSPPYENKFQMEQPNSLTSVCDLCLWSGIGLY